MTKQQPLPRVAYDTSLTSSCEFFLSITPQSDLWEKSLTRCGFSSGWLCSSPGLPILYSVICAHGGWLTPMTSWALPSLWDTGTSHAPHSQEVALRGGRLTFSRSGEKTLSPYSYFLCLCCAALHSLIVILIFFFFLTDKSVRKWTRTWISVTVPTLYWQFPFPSENDYYNMRPSVSYKFTPYDIFRSKDRLLKSPLLFPRHAYFRFVTVNSNEFLYLWHILHLITDVFQV